LAALAGGVIDIVKPDAISFSKTAAKAVVFHSDEDAALSIKDSASAIGTYALQYYCHGDVTGSRGCPSEYTTIISDGGDNTSVEDMSTIIATSSDEDFTMTAALWGVVAVVVALVFLVAILAIKYRSSSTDAEVATQVLRKMNSITPMGFGNGSFHGGFPQQGSFHGGPSSLNGSMADFNNSYHAFMGSQSMMTPHRVAWSPEQNIHSKTMSMGAPTPPVYKPTARKGPGMPAPKIDSALNINGVDRRPSMVTATMLNSQTGTKSNPLLNVSGIGYQYARETAEIGGSSETDLLSSIPNRRNTRFVEHPPMPPPVNVPENNNFSFAV